MRKLLSVAAIVVAAVGLLWLVRLNGRPSDPMLQSTADASSPTQADSEPMVANSERAAHSPRPLSGASAERCPRRLSTLACLPRSRGERSRCSRTGVRSRRTAPHSEAPTRATRYARGDGRTPEGTFYVCVKNPESKYHLSLGLSYPNIEDADRGLSDKLISKREHRVIVEAIRRYRQPPWNTDLGGRSWCTAEGPLATGLWAASP